MTMAVRERKGVVTAGPDAAVAQISIAELAERHRIEQNRGVGRDRLDELWELLRVKLKTVKP